MEVLVSALSAIGEYAKKHKEGGAVVAAGCAVSLVALAAFRMSRTDAGVCWSPEPAVL